MTPIRVVLAEDHEIVRTGLRMVIEHQDGLAVVAEAADGEQAVDAVLGHRPDVVLLDVQMPRLDGVAALRLLRARWDGPGAPPPALMLTTFDLDEYVYSALRAGAAGYVLKTAGPEELAMAIRQVAEGGAVLSPAVTARLIRTVTDAPRATAGTVPVRLDGLSDREREMLTLVAQGHSNVEIAARLGVPVATVKSRVSRMLAKLGVDNRVQAAIVAYETGMVRLGLP